MADPLTELKHGIGARAPGGKRQPLLIKSGLPDYGQWGCHLSGMGGWRGYSKTEAVTSLSQAIRFFLYPYQKQNTIVVARIQ